MICVGDGVLDVPLILAMPAITGHPEAVTYKRYSVNLLTMVSGIIKYSNHLEMPLTIRMKRVIIKQVLRASA